MSDRQQLTVPAPYPLCWPPTKLRTPETRRLPPRYKGTQLHDALHSVEVEVARWQRTDRDEKIVGWELTSNHVGRPTRELLDPGAALWFTLAGKQITGGSSLMVLACDRFRDLPQNIRALSLTMERLRLVADVGAYSLVAAVEGARALPPPSAANRPERPWRDVLGLDDGVSSLKVAEAVYKALSLEAGDGGPRVELNLAMEAARRELKR